MSRRITLLLLLLCIGYGYCARLVDFQVAQPPPLPREAKQCNVHILQRTFGASFGHPEVVHFTPPTDCGTPESWAGLSLNFTVTSNGTQFDRLGIFTFQNVEIWRTSTAEPVKDGIIWTYLKDVTRFLPLFSKPGTFILQLNNNPLTGNEGNYSATLEATFFASSLLIPPAPRADLIVPLMPVDENNTGNVASVPPGFSLNVTLPRNAVAAFAELQASGNGDEEFWYTSVPTQFLGDFPNGTFGDGPFREVRVLVDGQVAGVAFPYPVVFTGGIIPPAWRPIVAYGAFDMPTYHIDLTPFVPILTDGEPHTITLDVASAEEDHEINPNWYLSGLLQVKLDYSTLPTTGNITRYEASNFATSSVSKSARGEDINITVNAWRSVYIEAEIIAGSGARTEVVFLQNLEYTNVQSYFSSSQNLFQVSTGEVLSRHNGEIVLQDTFSYPFVLNYTSTSTDGSNFTAEIDHSYVRNLVPAPFILGTTIAERQIAGGSFHVGKTSSDNVGSNGTSNNTFDYLDTAGNTYTWQVNASRNVITFDRQGGNLVPSSVPDRSPAVSQGDTNMNVRLPGGSVIGAT